MNQSNWKGFERIAARTFGTKRNALSGMNSKITASDTLHPRLFIECKKRKRFSLYQLFRKVEQKANKESKIPVVAIKETGKKGWLILIRPEDLMAIAQEYKEK